MNLKDIVKDQFSDYWWSLLYKNFEEDYMIKIFQTLSEQSKKKIKIYPASKQVFKEYILCDYNQVTACFVIGEPIIDYKTSNIWQEINKYIEDECFNGLNLNAQETPDYLIKQGIFFLPVIRTKGLKDSHASLGWQNFTRDTIKRLNQSLNKIIFIYEDSCMEFMDKIDTNYHKIEKLEKGTVTKLKNFLKQEYNTNIIWT